MAILKIARMGHAVLSEPAKPVAEPSSPEIIRLVRDMVETMEDAPGTGLAAPQVHVSLRVVVFKVMPDRLSETPGDEPQPLTFLINPVIEPLTEETALGWEGCLSAPPLRGVVPRATRVRFKGLLLDGRPVEGETSGFQARILQHEVDHLDGVVYLDRMTDLSTLGYDEELEAAARAATDSGANL